MVTNRVLNQMISTATVDFTKLYGADHISQSDVIGKPWLERYTIALELWDRCDISARHNLANDPNQAVKAVALFMMSSSANRKHKKGVGNARNALV